MIVFPNAKINLGLHIVEKRSDAYHNIESLFFPIKLRDVLEIIPSETKDTEFSQSGIGLPAGDGENLVEKAWVLMAEHLDVPNVRMHLHKAIPFGAGLGGGSADASFALRCLNELGGDAFSDKELRELSAKIGADCPFFIENKPCLVSGIGDVLEPIDISLSPYFLVLVKPEIHVPTPKAYRYVKPQKRVRSIREIVELPVEKWKGRLINDFEASVFQQYPEIAQIKARLYEAGAVYASMSGSGASVYALFKNEIDLRDAFPQCFVYQQSL